MKKRISFSELDLLPESLIGIRLFGEGKSYFLWNYAKSYYQKLDHALDDIISDTQKDYLYPCFITLCSATLEYSLNLLYAVYCFEKFELKAFANYLDVYKKMRFKQKLFMLPHVLYPGKFEINENSRDVKALHDLIAKRNDLLHNSEKLHKFDVPDLNASLVGNNLVIPIENPIVECTFSVERNIVDTITKEDCITIGNAMLDFYQQVMLPYLDNRDISNCNFFIDKQTGISSDSLYKKDQE